jgi:hypothetical protein
MKKIYSLLCLVLLTTTSTFAQVEASGSTPVTGLRQGVSSAKTTGVKDTLTFHVDRSSSFTIYSVESGYLVGTGSDGLGSSYSEETGYYFDSIGDINVTDVFFWLARKQIVGPSDNIEARLYAVGPDSLPTTMLASGSANLAFLDTNVTVTLSTLAGFAHIPLIAGSTNVDAPFVVAVSYAGINDTIGIVSNVQGDGMGENRGVMLSTISFGGGWTKLANFWNIAGAPFDADPIIVPVVEYNTPVAIEDQVFHGKSFSFKPAFPSPASSTTTIEVTLREADALQLHVFDVTGRTLFDSGSLPLQAGVHSLVLPVSTWESGTYYYTVSTSKGRITSKFAVTH